VYLDYTGYNYVVIKMVLKKIIIIISRHTIDSLQSMFLTDLLNSFLRLRLSNKAFYLYFSSLSCVFYSSSSETIKKLHYYYYYHHHHHHHHHHCRHLSRQQTTAWFGVV